MKRKPQRAWAIVGYRGWINTASIGYTRKDVIAERVAQFRKYAFMAKHAALTDTQFWRVIKRRQGCCVARITLRVVK